MNRKELSVLTVIAGLLDDARKAFDEPKYAEFVPQLSDAREMLRELIALGAVDTVTPQPMDPSYVDVPAYIGPHGAVPVKPVWSAEDAAKFAEHQHARRLVEYTAKLFVLNPSMTLTQCQTRAAELVEWLRAHPDQGAVTNMLF